MAVHFITPAPVEVVVTGHELVGAKRPYAVYNIVVREDGEEWRLQRRWCAAPAPATHGGVACAI